MNDQGSNGYGFPWYRPSSYTLTCTRGELRQAGMTRAVAADTYRAITRHELLQDAGRYWVGVTANLRHDGEHLAVTSLWGIDQTPDHDGVPYLIDVATDLIGDAFTGARDAAPAIAARLRERARTLTGLLGPRRDSTAQAPSTTTITKQEEQQ